LLFAEKTLKIKESLLLTCGELNSEDVFKSITESHHQFCKYHGWENKGAVIATGVLNKGDIEKTFILDEVIELGSNF